MEMVLPAPTSLLTAKVTERVLKAAGYAVVCPIVRFVNFLACGGKGGAFRLILGSSDFSKDNVFRWGETTLSQRTGVSVRCSL